LELVPYIVRIVPKLEEEGIGARACSDAKFSPSNKISYLSLLATMELSDFNTLGERRPFLI
jgi:hypothetical protein